MTRRLLLTALLFTLLSGDMLAVKRFSQPSKVYAAGEAIYNIPPSANRKYTGLTGTFTRESWPGSATLDLAHATTDTNLVVPIGAGSLFPASGGRLSIENPDGTFELLQLLSRLGDVLTVARGQEGTTPIAIAPGATLVLLDLVIMTFQRTVDGQTWETVGGGAFPGGVVVDPRLGVLPSSSVGVSWLRDGVPVAQDGDTRVVVQTRVSLRTAITLEMQE